MSDNWLSVVTWPYLDDSGALTRLPTTNNQLRAPFEVRVFWGEPRPTQRVVWATPPDTSEVGFCTRLQAEFPGTTFHYVFVQAGEGFPITPGVVPPQQAFGC
jgi:hypothetical protein